MCMSMEYKMFKNLFCFLLLTICSIQHKILPIDMNLESFRARDFDLLRHLPQFGFLRQAPLSLQKDMKSLILKDPSLSSHLYYSTEYKTYKTFKYRLDDSSICQEGNLTFLKKTHVYSNDFNDVKIKELKKISDMISPFSLCIASCAITALILYQKYQEDLYALPEYHTPKEEKKIYHTFLRRTVSWGIFWSAIAAISSHTINLKKTLYDSVTEDQYLKARSAANAINDGHFESFKKYLPETRYNSFDVLRIVGVAAATGAALYLVNKTYDYYAKNREIHEKQNIVARDERSCSKDSSRA